MESGLGRWRRSAAIACISTLGISACGGSEPAPNPTLELLRSWYSENRTGLDAIADGLSLVSATADASDDKAMREACVGLVASAAIIDPAPDQGVDTALSTLRTLIEEGAGLCVSAVDEQDNATLAASTSVLLQVPGSLADLVEAVDRAVSPE